MPTWHTQVFRHVLNDDKATATKPSFSKRCAEEYFSRVYSATPRYSTTLSGCLHAHLLPSHVHHSFHRGGDWQCHLSADRSPHLHPAPWTRYHTPSSRSALLSCLLWCTCTTATGLPRLFLQHGRSA